MGKTKEIDFAKLIGFAAVSDHLSDGIDFRDEIIGDKLGAKVGAEPVQESKSLEFGKLLGFETVSDQIAGSLNFQEETLSAKLGAKVGAEVNAPGSLHR
jgi:hypothetical protein